MLFPAMLESPVVMSNSRGISADTIAEHVIAVTLARFRKLPLAFHTSRSASGRRKRSSRRPSLRTIAGSHVLIIGLGAIGTRHGAPPGGAWRARDRHPAQSGARRRRKASRPSSPPARLRALLPAADVVVIAAPQTRDTRRA